MPSGISLVTKGIISRIIVKRLYYPLTINLEDRKPTIELRPIKKKIHLNTKCEE